MKILLILLIFILTPSPCLAWDKEDTALQVTVVSLLLADMSQTLYIVDHADKYRELNPVLGEHPSKEKVYAYFLGVAIVHTAVSYLIEKIPGIENPKLYRRWWQGTFIIVEGGNNLRNSILGIGFSY